MFSSEVSAHEVVFLFRDLWQLDCIFLLIVLESLWPCFLLIRIEMMIIYSKVRRVLEVECDLEGGWRLWQLLATSILSHRVCFVRLFTVEGIERVSETLDRGVEIMRNRRVFVIMVCHPERNSRGMRIFELVARSSYALLALDRLQRFFPQSSKTNHFRTLSQVRAL